PAPSSSCVSTLPLHDALPISCSLSDSAVYYKILWPLSHFGIQVVVEHAECRLLLPAFAFDFQTFFCSYFSGHIIRSLYKNFSRIDRKSTRLNSSHVSISYAVF